MSKHFRLTYCPPLGRHIPVDTELLAVFERDRRRADRSTMLDRILWACVVVLCAWCFGLWITGVGR